VSSYLLAGSGLTRVSVVSLLMSSSFGLNAIFYAAWLGYAIGLWALGIQLAWSIGFLLLSRYATKVKSHRSLHHLLGDDFGKVTRLVAGVCSLVGMMYMIGWETEIARRTIGTLLTAGPAQTPPEAAASAGLLAIGVVVACLLYTVLGGLKGNALADKVLNATKVVCLLVIVAVLGRAASATPGFSWSGALFSSRDSFFTYMGWFGLATNLVFNLSWQFVDASSWQSVIAGSSSKPTDARDNLVASAVAIFVMPGLIGTLFGIVLHGTENITADNIVARASMIGAATVPVLSVVCAVMIIASVMSLLDGMFLASAFTLIVDIRHPSQSLMELEDTPLKAEVLLTKARLAIAVIATVAAIGVHKLMSLLGVSVFDFVYILIITQISLLGPILVALKRKRNGPVAMWLPILVAIVAGFSSAWVGTHGGDQRWADAAGSVSALSSVALAFALSRNAKATTERSAL